MDPLEQAAAFDFRALWHEDVEAGRERSLAEYLQRFPAHEAAVAREWQALTQSLAPAPIVQAPLAVDAENQIGPYRLVRPLGRGGQGEVHLAEDTRVAGRMVALKVLDGVAAGLTTARSQRLRREAQALARLDHPGICPLLDANFEGARPWLAMRYVRGQTLQATLAAKRQLPRTVGDLHVVLLWLERLALATHAAHDAGLLHRDIKPANVMIDQDGLPVLLDFGLVRDEDAETLAMTRSGEVFGTLAYMAPEQLQGRRDIDRRVDVYALGVTLYECLAAVSPFAATTSQEATRAILAGVCLPLRKVNSAIPRDLAIVVATAMELARERRYATARELAEDLANVRERRPTRARAASLPLRALRWMQRHPVAAATMTVLTFALAAVSLLVFLLSAQTRELLAWKRAENTAKLMASDPSRALAEAALALDDFGQHEIRASLHAALARNHEVYSRPLLHHEHGNVGVTAWPVLLDAQRTLFAGTNCGDLVAWRAADGEPGRVVHGPETSAIQCLLRSNDGAKVLVGVGSGNTYMLDAEMLAGGQWRGSVHAGDRRAILAGAVAAGSGQFFAGGVGGRIEWYPAAAGPDGVLAPNPLPDFGDEQVVGLWPHPDGRQVLVHTLVPKDASEGKRTLHCIDVEQASARVVASFPLSGDIEAEWSPDGEHFVMIEAAGTLQVMRKNGDAVWSNHDPAALLSAHFTPDGKKLLTFGLRGLLVYDAKDGAVLKRTESTSGRSFEDGWFAPEGDVLVVTIKDQTLRLFDARTFEELGVLGRTSGFGRAARWCDGGTFALVDHGSLRGYRIRHPVSLVEAKGHTAPVVSLAFAPDGTAVASASDDGTVRIVDLAVGVVRRVFECASKPTRVLATGERLLVVAGEPEARLWPWRGTADAIVLRGHVAPIVDAWPVVGADAVVTVAADGARVWSGADGRLLQTFPTNLGALRVAAANADLDLLAVAGAEPLIDVFSLSSGKRLRRLDATPTRHWTAGPTRLHFDSKNHRLLAAAPYGGVLHTWRTSEDFAYTGVVGVGSSIGWAVTDAGGRWLMSAEQSLDSAGWYDAATLAPMAWDPAWQSGTKVSRLQFAADGRFALMASYDGTVRLFDPNACTLWSVLPSGHGGALDATFSPSGDRVAVGYKDGTVMVWPSDPSPMARAILARHSYR